MTNFKSTEEVLDFAIKNEEEAAAFYMEMKEKVNNPGMKITFQNLAKEEEGHKKRLQAVKDGKKLLNAQKQVQDLKISDYLVDVKPHKDMNYQEILMIVMKQEKAAYKLYNDLAASTDDANLKNIFLGLAQEEAGHKLRFETQYDDEIYREN